MLSAVERFVSLKTQSPDNLQYTGLNIKYQVAMIPEWYAHELDSVTPTASKDMIISVAVHHKIKVVHL